MKTFRILLLVTVSLYFPTNAVGLSHLDKEALRRKFPDSRVVANAISFVEDQENFTIRPSTTTQQSTQTTTTAPIPADLPLEESSESFTPEIERRPEAPRSLYAYPARRYRPRRPNYEDEVIEYPDLNERQFVLDRQAIDGMLMYINNMINCGPGGWCGFRCCADVRRSGLIGGGVVGPRRKPSALMRRRHPQPYCATVCQPECNLSCIRRFKEIMNGFMGSMSGGDGEFGGNDLGFRIPPRQISAGLDACILETSVPPIACRPACMPLCTKACVEAPPLMVACAPGDACFCPAGYVQCAESTCCMKYRTMAVRYRDRLPTYIYHDSDRAKLEKNDNGDNQTSVYVKALRKMDGNIVHELPRNGTVIFYPDHNKAEIVFDDGEVIVESGLALTRRAATVAASSKTS